MRKDIIINDNLVIPYGNMGIIHDISGHESLYELCISLEQNLKINDYSDTAHKIRKTLEEFVLCEEIKKRIEKSNGKYNYEMTRNRVTIDIKNGNTSYFDLAVELSMNSKNKNKIVEIIDSDTYSGFNYTGDEKAKITTFLRNLFRFGSQNSHQGTFSDRNKPDFNNCRIFFKSLYLFLCAYYGAETKYDGSKVPFGEYYPIPKKISKDLGIELPPGQNIYIKLNNEKSTFYLFVNSGEEESVSDRRNIETLHKLWTENIEYPQNVIRNAEFVSNKNGIDQKALVYPLPSLPRSLTDPFISELSISERLQLCRGIINGIKSMHTAEPPFYHRVLSVSSFLVCKIKDKLQPLLVNFECAKDTDPNAEYTVIAILSDKISAQNEYTDIIAPELDDGLNVDWEKVDIYALGKVILKICTNSYIIPDTKPEFLSESQFNLLLSCFETDPEKRPSAQNLIKEF